MDENGNYIKEITENSKNAQFIPYKHAEPTVNGGISNSLRYKWLDLNFLFSYQSEDILMILGHKRQNMAVTIPMQTFRLIIVIAGKSQVIKPI